MADERKLLSWLPGGLIAAGLFFLMAGVLSGGPDVVGGIVFGVVLLAVAVAILHRRAKDAHAATLKVEATEPFSRPPCQIKTID